MPIAKALRGSLCLVTKRSRVGNEIPLRVYSVEKLDVEVGDYAALSSKRGLHSG
jgi:hypothetical protein